MHFAGLQKNSLIDFPGKLSCVAFVTGCNLACPFCHNPELARGRYPQRITREDLLHFLRQRRKLLDGVVISGGEPTLTPDLAEICRDVHAMGLAVKLDTNGSRPDVLSGLIDDGLIDYVAMDVKTAPDRYHSLLTNRATQRLVEKSIHLLMQGGVDYEFRTTCVRPFIDDETVLSIARSVQGARRYALQTFRSEVLLNPAFFIHAPAGFSPAEMDRMRQAASPWVAECLVR